MGYRVLKMLDRSPYSPRFDRTAGYVLQDGSDGKVIRPFYSSRSDRGMPNSTRATPEEFTVLFGINKVEKFLPDDHRIYLENYKQFLQHVEQYILTVNKVQIKLTDWNEETSEILADIHDRTPGAERFDIWLEERFEYVYKLYLKGGFHSVVRKWGTFF